jgi:uncharacterized protein (DUF1330 family)
MNNKLIQSIKVMGKHYVYIESVDKKYSLDERFYAINWFNTKALWLYNFYNFLATSQVKKVGGHGVFKGRVQEVLFGNKDDRRDVVLIVTYPKAEQFKKLFEMYSFKAVSILRMLAVKDFTFGFTHRSDENKIVDDKNKDLFYAIHHYKFEYDISSKVALLTQNSKVEILYSGLISALLYNGNVEKKQEQIPCLMDGVIILKSQKLDDLKQFVKTDKYQVILNETKSAFVATLKRLL